MKRSVAPVSEVPRVSFDLRNSVYSWAFSTFQNFKINQPSYDFVRHYTQVYSLCVYVFRQLVVWSKLFFAVALNRCTQKPMIYQEFNVEPVHYRLLSLKFLFSSITGRRFDLNVFFQYAWDFTKNPNVKKLNHRKGKEDTCKSQWMLYIRDIRTDSTEIWNQVLHRS